MDKEELCKALMHWLYSWNRNAVQIWISKWNEMLFGRKDEKNQLLAAMSLKIIDTISQVCTKDLIRGVSMGLGWSQDQQNPRILCSHRRGLARRVLYWEQWMMNWPGECRAAFAWVCCWWRLPSWLTSVSSISPLESRLWCVSSICCCQNELSFGVENAQDPVESKGEVK